MTEKQVQVPLDEPVAEGELKAINADGTPVLLSRIDGRLHAVINRCPHLNMKMTRGKIVDGVVVCPWHGSRFDFCTGKNLDWVNSVAGLPMPGWTHKLIAMGKSPAGLISLAVEEQPDSIIITLSETVN